MIISPIENFDYNPFYYDEKGNKCWSSTPADMYHVTGVDRTGKRFKVITDNWRYAAGINVWQGSKWLVRGKKRFLISRVYN